MPTTMLPQNNNRSVSLLFLSTFFSAAMGVQVKTLTTLLPVAQRLPDLQVTCLRFLFGLAMMLALVATGRLSLCTQRIGGLILRSLFGTAAVALYFYSITHGQLTTGTLLSYTYVIFAAIFSALWLREWPQPKAILALAVALLGLVILVRPDFHHVSAGDLAGLASGVIGGLAITTIRDLRRTEPAALIFLWLCLCGGLSTGIVLLLASLGVLDMAPPRAPQGSAIVLLLGVCIAGTFGQLLLTWGLRYTSALLATLISLTAVPLSAVGGILFFGERPAMHVVIGGVIVLAAGTYLSVCENSTGAPKERGPKVVAA